MSTQTKYGLVGIMGLLFLTVGMKTRRAGVATVSEQWSWCRFPPGC